MTPNHKSGGVKKSNSNSNGWLYKKVDSLLAKDLGFPNPFVNAKELLLIAQVRGFAPIGMLELWNIGNMGSGIMECWI